MKKRFFGMALLLVTVTGGRAENEAADTVAVQHDMPELVVSGGVKQFGTLEQQPMSAQKFLVGAMRKRGVETIKGMSAYVPNLFYPDYGSRLTSAIYIRGIGSRANTPVVGMYVDDVALMEKSSFDFMMGEAERVEVLRGPQSTLYGRGTMGGLIKVYTPSPLEEGNITQMRLGTSTKDGSRLLYAHHSHLLTQGLGLAVSGFYQGNDGYNFNSYLGRRSNGGDSGGGKLRLTYQRSPRFSLDFQTSAEYSDENAYDYADATTGLIQSGFLGNYRRTLLTSSLKVQSQQRHFTVSSVTAYQFLRDHMFMDQDYMPADIFRLHQHQRSHSISEELVFKGNSLDWLEWTGDAYLAYQSLNTSAPVTFGQDGIQSLIQAGIDRGFSAANAAVAPMGMSMAMNVTDRSMVIDGDFKTPLLNVAAFAQLRFKDLITRGLDLTVGIRLDHEHRRMDYNSGVTSHFNFKMSSAFIPMPPINRDFTTFSGYEGVLRDNQTRALPKVALSYRFDPDNAGNLVYASVSNGLRSGGYNIQMFGDLLQMSLRNDMMRTLANDPQLGPRISSYVDIADNPSADSATVFKPETSWNYEVGAHATLLNGHLTLHGALFYILVNDVQVTRFASNRGFGRQVLNAGKSQSCGAELALSGWFNLGGNPLRLNANYGYTRATFKDYDAGELGGQQLDYSGNYVPFAPQHTMAFSADYAFPIGKVLVDIGVNTTGVGRVYWTEDNTASEPYYQLLGAHIGCQYKILSLDLWGNNLTNKNYVPFYFVSQGRGFAQRSRPRQFGATLTLRF